MKEWNGMLFSLVYKFTNCQTTLSVWKAHSLLKGSELMYTLEYLVSLNEMWIR